MKIFTTTILLALSLLTALLFETKMSIGNAFELLAIVVGIIIAFGILFSLWIEAEWAYPLAILFFAAATANLLWLHLELKTFLLFAFGLLVNVAGMVVAFASIENEQWEEPLETYEIKDKKKR